MDHSADRATSSLVNSKLVYAHGIAALVTLLIAVIFGVVISLQFIFPDLNGQWLPMGWGRLRYAHTQGIMLGWLGNAFLAFLYHAVPVLTGRAVTSSRLGMWMFGIWNFAVMLPGWILVLAGVSQPLEWAEFPLIVDAFVIVAFLMAAIQFLPPFFRRGLADLYVSSWYVIGALVFTLLSYPMGNVVPEFVAGAAGAAFSGLWIHDAVGLFVTPLALAILYFVIPASTGRPIYSHFLSMLGFWGLFFLYPLNGTHHYIFSVIPMEAQLTAIAASALLGVIVVIVVSNLMLSQRGAGLLPRDPALRFVSMSVVFYLIVSVQGALQAQMSLNQAVHFTDWVVGHSHLAMLGFATFAAIGGIVHAWQRIPWARYNARAIEWSYWLLVVGISIMFIDLTIAGVIQGQLWQSGAPWLESVQASRPYWIIRTLAAIPIAAGFVALLVGLTSGSRGAEVASGYDKSSQAIPNPVDPVLLGDAAKTPARALMMSYVVASIAGIAFFGLSVTLLGVWPKRVLAEQAAMTAPANPLPFTNAALRGKAVYAREGCAYCHTQQIRYTAADSARFGAPTLAWETRFDYPHLFGTRRIGPDLSRAGGTRTEDWHYLHLFAPRAAVPLSMMPSYAALFDGAPDRPSQDARDLIDYIETLGQARELAWPEADIAALDTIPNNKWAQMSLTAEVLNAHPARSRPRGSAPPVATAAADDVGEQLWQDHCTGCHGEDGRGDGPGAKWLNPQPPNFAAREYTLARVWDVLWNGVHGTAMPAWRDHTPENLAALANVVRAFSDLGDEPKPTPDELDIGRNVYKANCAECHGDNGGGDGFAANDFPITPTSFKSERVKISDSVLILRNGVKGTSMAPWTDRLTDEEILAVSHFVQTFFLDNGTPLENAR